MPAGANSTAHALVRFTPAARCTDVEKNAGGGGVRVDGTNGDDAGLVALLQVGQCGPNRSLPRQHLDIEVGLECLIGDGLARPGVRPTSIIDQNIHAAKGGGGIFDKLFHLLGVVTSATKPWVVPVPRAFNSDSTAATSSALRAQNATLAPASISDVTVASPSPLLPPVTMRAD